GVFVSRAVAPAVFYRHLDKEGNIIGKGGNDMLGINDLHSLVGNDVGSLDDAAFMPINAQGTWLLTGILYHKALDIQDDIGHVLDNPRNRADLVLYSLDLDPGHSAAFQARQKDAAQAVANGHTKAALERFSSEFAISVGQCASVAADTTGQLETTP